MRKLCAGWMIAMGLLCGVTMAQVVQPQPQPGAAGQLRPGQAAPGQQTIQPGQPAIQPGQARQQTQPGQPQTIQPGQQLPQRQFGQQGQESSADQQIAAAVYGACHNEIEIAKLGEQKAQSEEVRDFAQRMVRDHTPGCQEMERLAGSLVSETTQPQRTAAGGLDWISIHKQIGQQCLASVKQELSQKSAADFDECFMGLQIGEHLAVVDKLKVLRNYASPDLQQKLDKELQSAQQHLQLAKQIEQKLKDRPSERVSRRPDGSNK